MKRHLLSIVFIVGTASLFMFQNCDDPVQSGGVDTLYVIKDTLVTIDTVILSNNDTLFINADTIVTIDTVLISQKDTVLIVKDTIYIGVNDSSSFLDLTLQSFQNVSFLSTMTYLKWLSLQRCGFLTDISGLGTLKRLEYLDLSGCQKLEDFSPLSTLGSLKELNLDDCI